MNKLSYSKMFVSLYQPLLMLFKVYKCKFIMMHFPLLESSLSSTYGLKIIEIIVLTTIKLIRAYQDFLYFSYMGNSSKNLFDLLFPKAFTLIFCISIFLALLPMICSTNLLTASQLLDLTSINNHF